MIKKIPIGKYIPGNSFLHKLDTRTKILISLVVTAFCFWIKNVFLLFAIFFLCIVMIKLSKVRILSFLRSKLPLIIFSLVTTFISIFFEVQYTFLSKGEFILPLKSIENSVIVFLRLMIIISVASSLMFTTSPSEISLSIEKILKPLNFIGLSSRDVALTITITLRFIPTIFDQANKILNAQRSRGAEFKSKNIFKNVKSLLSVVVPLLVSSINTADDLAVALEARCYDGSKDHTEFKNLKFKKEDLIAFVFLGLFILGVVICKIAIKGI